MLAAADTDEELHDSCIEVLSRAELLPVIPTLVLAEVCHLVGNRLGAMAEAQFLRTVSRWEIESPRLEDLRRAADLVERYADLRLGGVDASVVATAERLAATKIITLDRKHFSVVQPKHIEAFELLPA